MVESQIDVEIVVVSDVVVVVVVSSVVVVIFVVEVAKDCYVGDCC